MKKDKFVIDNNNIIVSSIDLSKDVNNPNYERKTILSMKYKSPKK